MTITWFQALAKYVKEVEGLKNNAYLDSGGVWTIGAGATGPDIKKGVAWTDEQIDQDLNKRLRLLVAEVDDLLTVELSDWEFIAIISLVYNIGLTAFKKSTMLKLLNANSKVKARAEFDKWVFDNKVKVPGLVNRRNRDKEMFDGKNELGVKGLSRKWQLT